MRTKLSSDESTTWVSSSKSTKTNRITSIFKFEKSLKNIHLSNSTKFQVYYLEWLADKMIGLDIQT